MAAQYGLRKAPARLIGAQKVRAVAAVLGRLRQAADAAMRSAVWPAIRDTIEDDPGPFLMALGIELEPATAT